MHIWVWEALFYTNAPDKIKKKKKLQGKKVFTFLNSEDLPPSSNKVQNRHKNELQNLRNGNNNR